MRVGASADRADGPQTTLLRQARSAVMDEMMQIVPGLREARHNPAACARLVREAWDKKSSACVGLEAQNRLLIELCAPLSELHRLGAPATSSASGNLLGSSQASAADASTRIIGLAPHKDAPQEPMGTADMAKR